MPLQSFKKILRDAMEGGYAVGYFEPWDQYSMEAVILAAENLNSPVIIGCGGIMMNQRWFDCGGMECLVSIGRILAERAKVPTALMLNEAVTFEQIIRGLSLGFNAVMLHTSSLSFEENLQITKRVVEAAHALGANVEAELGHVPLGFGEKGKNEGSLTDPDQAVEFILRTGADALAVSIGNIHIMLEGKADKLDFERLGKIHQKVDIPLVIHGSTGFPDSAISKVISLGVAKFNVGTMLKKTFWLGLKEAIDSTPESANPHDVIGSRKGSDIVACAHDFMRQGVERLIALYLNKQD
jgi:ketose-bisphosphate aldolase